ncbi:serine hydrolase [Porticoccus sp. W117]|uniref:serine hydrolase domain-containing protein n=1 Tax=Porticoccus sp. W117 TaxID=3054777 RepID=UPI00259257A9|nr:serine hydrolase [Porticoccus sp. W117]MDM3870062.1 serine hydrolase [Porticoccus sp. W117]
MKSSVLFLGAKTSKAISIPASVLWVLSLLLACSLVRAGDLPAASPEALGMSSDRLQRLDKQLQAYVDNKKLAGSVALVARKGRVAYWKAFGYRDLESNQPMQRDTLFRIASQTKSLVSVGIMLLQEEGRLLISDPVDKYLPEFAKTTVAVVDEAGGYQVVDAKRPITIRDLLTHTAGVGYGEGLAADRWKAAGIQGYYFADRDEPIAETVNRMAALPFEAQPGEKFVYGYSTDILGVVIEKASGQTLDAFLKTRLFEPLGMHDTHFYLPKSKKARLAVVYSSTDKDDIERAPNPGTHIGQGAYLNGPRKSFSGGAGLLSTAMDYSRYLQMLLNGGELDGKRILSPKTVELMTVNHLDGLPFNKGNGFGLGFYVTHDLGASGELGSVGQYGWGGAYFTTYWVDPREELLVVFMTQLVPAKGVDAHQKLRSLVYQAITQIEINDYE